MSRGGDRGGYGRNDRSAGTFNAPERVLTPNPSLYIGNLLFDVTAQDLEKEFSEYGTIKSATIATDPRGLSKG
jgi:RNA recognition motif-containing protein